jgi:hypothetical protein
MMKWILLAVGTLILGLVLGFFIGRVSLERQWQQPIMQITPDMERRSKVADAEPTPKAGSKVLMPLPLERARLVVKSLAAKDPVVVTVGTFGNNEEGGTLHLRMENRGTCKVTAFEGVAYGFDAYGRPAAVNKGGENYVAFASRPDDKVSIDAKEAYQLEHKTKFDSVAALAVAHVDRVSCEDGSKWTRQ